MQCQRCMVVVHGSVDECPRCGGPFGDVEYEWQLMAENAILGFARIAPDGTFAFTGDAGRAMVMMLENLRGVLPPGSAAGPFLNGFVVEELPALTEGNLRGVVVGTRRERAPALGCDYAAAPVRYKSNELPDPAMPETLLPATEAGQLIWATTSDGGGFKAGGSLGARPGVWLTLSDHGPSGKRKGPWTLTITHGTTVLDVVRQKDGLFSRCLLGKLWAAITPEPPLPAHAVPPTGAPPRRVSLGHPAVREPLSEPQWARHLAEGRVMYRAAIGDGQAELVMLDVRHVSLPLGMRYSFRAFVLPGDGGRPTLAFNHESSQLGTHAFGMHQGSMHVNLGEAPPTIDFDAFSARALQALGVG